MSQVKNIVNTISEIIIYLSDITNIIIIKIVVVLIIWGTPTVIVCLVELLLL